MPEEKSNIKKNLKKHLIFNLLQAYGGRGIRPLFLCFSAKKGCRLPSGGLATAFAFFIADIIS